MALLDDCLKLAGQFQIDCHDQSFGWFETRIG